jgi:hypothetical protein
MVSLPEATTIDPGAISGCIALTTVNIPRATSIGATVFQNTGTQDLTVTLRNTTPSVGALIFNGVTAAKTVTVLVPAGATGYNSSWETNFKGGNSNITLDIQSLP